MGDDRLTRAAYHVAHTAYVPTRGSATARAEQHAKRTGKLDPLVDPAEYGVIRRSLIRFDQRPDGLYVVTVGLPVPIEIRLDTTGSMGSNVDKALRVLPDTYELASRVLPGCDPHMAIGIFGDRSDNFILCRPQFEMTADKLVHQLTLMVPEREGGDAPEDPHYGIFGAAYLTAAYINRIGLKRYDFTVSDAPARDRLNPTEIVRVFGKDVYDKVAENDHQIVPHVTLHTKDVVNDLLAQAHAFFLQVGDSSSTRAFWTDLFGPERVVLLPSVELLPQVQAAIIGLTEGTLDPDQLTEFLSETGVDQRDAKAIVRSVINIPIAAQAALPNFERRPKVGDVFHEKTDLWPMDPSEVPALTEAPDESVDNGPEWL